MYLVNAMLRRPVKGWPEPGKKGSRAIFAGEIKKDEVWLSSQKTENVYITSYDGLKLFARLLPAAESPQQAKGSVLMMHGFHSTASFEFAGIYNYFHKEGYNVLLCDMRAHGKSGGKYLTFGIRERYDCRDWIQYLYKRYTGNLPIWVMGISMGSTSVLMATGLPLPDNVKGFIADCGYTDPHSILKIVLTRDYHLPADIILPVADIITRIQAGFSITEYSTVTALKKNHIPVLFIHGDKDTFVPFEMSEENYDACAAPKQFLKTHADHAASYLSEPEAYRKALKEFMK